MIQDGAVRTLASLRSISSGTQTLKPFFISTSPITTLKSAAIGKVDQSIALSFGLFATANKFGQNLFVCQLYDKIEILYESNVSSIPPVGNELKTMTIESPCRIADGDIQKLKTILIDPSKILSQPPADGVIPVDESGQTIAHFQNIEGEWPRKWNFKSISFLSSQSDYLPLKITPANELTAIPSNLNMIW